MYLSRQRRTIQFVLSGTWNDNTISIKHMTELIGQNKVDKLLAVEKDEIEVLVLVLVFFLDSLQN